MCCRMPSGAPPVHSRVCAVMVGKKRDLWESTVMYSCTLKWLRRRSFCVSVWFCSYLIVPHRLSSSLYLSISLRLFVSLRLSFQIRPIGVLPRLRPVLLLGFTKKELIVKKEEVMNWFFSFFFSNTLSFSRTRVY